MSCAQVAGMSTAGLVAMRSSCPRNPGNGNASNSKKNENDGYGAEVTKPGPHDVLLGRGGGTNNHSGNINFRKLVNEHKMRYLACSKIEKPNVAREVVELWKKLDPPGRFLTRKEEIKSSRPDGGEEQVLWVEVPEKKAREKASQCLRERTPDVVPYIRQLREQQDQMTEQGVSMVQQQLKMQREAEAQKHGMAAGYQQRRNSLAEQNPYQTGSMNPVAPMSGGGGDFQNRRGSMPMMQTGNGMMKSMQHQQQQAFSRRISAPHLSSGGNGMMPNNATSMMGQMNPQYNGMGMEPGFCGSDGGMYDPAYASSMTAMQLQQHYQQQMQLQQLQQQQQMLQQQMAMQQQHMASVNMQAQMNMPMDMMGGGNQMDQWNMQQQHMMNMQQQQNGGMHGMQRGGNNMNHLQENSHHSQSGRASKKDNSSSRRTKKPDAPKSSADSDIEPIPLPKPDRSTSADIGGDSKKKKPAPPAARDSSPKRPNRDREETPSSSNHRNEESKKKQPAKAALKTDKAPQAAMRRSTKPIDPPVGSDDDDIPLPLNAHGGDEEVGIEEYRKTLESYMVSNNISQQQQPVYYSDEEEDLSVESFPEWPDEGPSTKKRMGRAAPGARGVDRHKSGQSMMSCTTAKSNATSLSGLSMLSDMMSMESGKSLNSGVHSNSERGEKMSATKRFSSTASIMSELTDISHTIDGLGLDDDI